MIRKWDGAMWKIDIHASKNLVMQRFAPDSDFPYSRVECPVDKIIEEPSFNPCGGDLAFEGEDSRHKQSGHISFAVENMPQLWDLILTIINEGEEV